MRIGDVTNEYLCEYLKIGDLSGLDASEVIFLEAIKAASLKYILSYTGIPKEELDDYEDLTITYIVLIADMYDQRAMYVEGSNVNRTIESILSSYRFNLL